MILNRTIGKVAGAIAFAVAATGTAFVAPAHAVVLPCGSLVSTSVTLTADVGPCPGQGLTIVASGVTLDLGGHKVFGQANPGQGPGIVVANGRTNVTVRNGEVTLFDAGVVTLGGSGHLLEVLYVHDNIGPSNGNFGDGIVFNGTDSSTIRNNQIIHNGPYDGIGMFGNTDNNTVTGNAVRFNNVLGVHHDPQDPAMQDTGIRLENGSDFNLVSNNDVTNNGLDGIEIFATSDNNTVSSNRVAQNGFNNNPVGGLRVGDGINAFSGANGNTIRSNASHQNAGHGIVMYPGATANFILTNQAFGNNAQPVASRPAYDLADYNANCDANQWHGNQGATFNQPCVLAP